MIKARMAKTRQVYEPTRKLGQKCMAQIQVTWAMAEFGSLFFKYNEKKTKEFKDEHGLT